MDWNLIISFCLGALGALVIVWLRWIDALPRFKSAIEIAKLEVEYDIVSNDIIKKIQDKLPVNCCEVTHSENLRDDIWRQRRNSFLVSAVMYVVLGGATALVFVGLDIQNALDSTSIIKLISAGALWSTFYSFIEVKNVDKIGLSKMAEENKKMVENIADGYQEKIKDSYKDIQTIRQKYNSVIEEYQEKIKESNDNIELISKNYNLLLEEYQKISGLQNETAA